MKTGLNGSVWRQITSRLINSTGSPAATINSSQITSMALHNEIIIRRRGERLVDSKNSSLISEKGLVSSVETKDRTSSIPLAYQGKKDFN